MSNNAFGLGGRTFLSWADNTNRVDQKVIRGDTRALRGRVVNVKDYHHISQHYDVALQDYKEIDGSLLILRACKRIVEQASFDNVGEFSPLEEGDPVLLVAPNGKLEDSVIIGSYYTIGDYSKYYREGQADKPFTTYPSEFTGIKTAAQPSAHPSRIAQPDSYVHIVGGKNKHEPFTDPRYFNDRKDQRNASPQIGSIEIKNKVGDVVQYSTGAQVFYSDAEILILTNADGSSRCKRLNDMAAYYVEMAKHIRSYLGLSTESEVSKEEGEDPSTISSGIVSYVDTIDNNRSDIGSIDFNEWSPTQYHLDQASKLACLYRTAAQSCMESDVASSRIAEAMSKQEPLTSTSVAHSPREENYVVPKCNYGAGRPESNYSRLVVLHETGESAQSAINYITNESSGVSYHSIVKRDGTIVRLVPITDTAYGAGCSSFPSVIKDESKCNSLSDLVSNVEAVCLSPSERVASNYSQGGCGTIDATTCSVNPFAIHYSLESGNYTNEQYQSLAKLIIESGVPAERVTSHYNVDNSGTRTDPRNLDLSLLNKELARQGFSGEISFEVIKDE